MYLEANHDDFLRNDGYLGSIAWIGFIKHDTAITQHYVECLWLSKVVANDKNILS